MKFLRRSACFAALIPLALYGQQGPEKYPEAPFIPTPPEVIQAMLKLADVHRGDLVYDLGCGDGRIVVAAAQRDGVKGVGVDVDRERLRDARENARKAGVAGRVRFVEQDLFETDIREASVVMLYLIPSLLERLGPRLRRELQPGTRVVSYEFEIPAWEPVKRDEVNGRKIYLWVVPGRRD